MDSIERLVGRTVTAIGFSADKTVIQFETDAGPVAFLTEGDCCSESWINHVSDLSNLIGRTVDRVEKVTMNGMDAGQPGHSGRQECDQLYGFKVFTPRGACLIEMRNSSNGYYGGWLADATPAPNLQPCNSDF